VVVVFAYVLLILFAGLLAWFLWQFPAIRRLDNRVLGDRGIAIVASVAAFLLVAGTAAAFAQRVWGAAVVYALMSVWVGYWAYRRASSLRHMPVQ
jgi:hypothetical protein